MQFNIHYNFNFSKKEKWLQRLTSCCNKNTDWITLFLPVNSLTVLLKTPSKSIFDSLYLNVNYALLFDLKIEIDKLRLL